MLVSADFPPVSPTAEPPPLRFSAVVNTVSGLDNVSAQERLESPPPTPAGDLSAVLSGASAAAEEVLVVIALTAVVKVSAAERACCKFLSVTAVAADATDGVEAAGAGAVAIDVMPPAAVDADSALPEGGSLAKLPAEAHSRQMSYEQVGQ